nr:NAD(P)H-dependent oxidoreductase [Brevibacterium sp. XM4083]
MGTVRPGRRGPAVAAWVADIVDRRCAAVGVECEVKVIDIADIGLGLTPEPNPPKFGLYEREETRAWAEVVAGLDAFVFVTPEYNHSVPSALKNAVDTLYGEWSDKVAGIVSYGVNGGVRAAEHLRQILGELQVATVAVQPALGMFEDFVIADPLATGDFAPRDLQRAAVESMVDQLTAWATAFATFRAAAHAQ